VNILSKLRDFVGLSESVEYDYEYEEVESGQYPNTYQPPQPPPAAPAVDEDRRNSRRLREKPVVAPTPSTEITPTSGVIGSAMNNVIGMPGAINGISEVMVLEPRSFEEMPAAIRALKERKSVVLNLTIMDPDQAQRAVDFVAGGTYALDGHQERIGESIFLFTPSCVQVRTQSGVVHEVPGTPDRPRMSGTAAPIWQNQQQMVQ
jgi:cell division inhibitor SepF